MKGKDLLLILFGLIVAIMLVSSVTAEQTLTLTYPTGGETVKNTITIRAESTNYYSNISFFISQGKNSYMWIGNDFYDNDNDWSFEYDTTEQDDGDYTIIVSTDYWNTGMNDKSDEFTIDNSDDSGDEDSSGSGSPPAEEPKSQESTSAPPAFEEPCGVVCEAPLVCNLDTGECMDECELCQGLEGENCSGVCGENGAPIVEDTNPAGPGAAFSASKTGVGSTNMWFIGFAIIVIAALIIWTNQGKISAKSKRKRKKTKKKK